MNNSNNKIFCLALDMEIDVSECDENRECIPECAEKAYGDRLKKNWREICDKCKYSEY